MNECSNTTFPQQIASTIEGKIRSGVYKVGDQLPTESQLSVRFGVSRGTVREALKSLMSLGLLESRQGSGTYVKAKERLQIAMFQTLSEAEERDIEHVRSMLEREIAISAANSRDKEDINRLKLILQEMRFGLTPVNHAFHLSLAAATHNRLLYSLYRYVSEYQKMEDKANHALYEELCKAIEHSDAELAGSAISRILNS